MLDAFNKKNVRRLLVTRTSEHIPQRNEDAITSMVFTPLRFMQFADAHKCLELLFNERFPHGDGCSSAIQQLDIELWPRIRNPQVGVCEPDLVVKIHYVTDCRIILVGEMKWEWRLSASDLNAQLRRQKEATEHAEPDAKVFPFAIVSYKTHEHGNCEFPVFTWKDVHRQLQLPRHISSLIVRRWCESITEFLHKAEQTVFAGFSLDYLPQGFSGSVAYNFQPANTP